MLGKSITEPEEREATMTVDLDKILMELAEPFPQELLRENKAKGLIYVPVAEVIARLNRVLGVPNWSTSIVRTWREPDHPDWVLSLVRLTITIGDQTFEREGIGGQQVKHRKSGDVVDLGDEYKGAYSDALKKAAQSLGVALELARTDEALAYEEFVPAEPTPESRLFSVFKTHLDSMSVEQKTELKNWWGEKYPNAGAPSTTSSLESLNQAIAFAVKITIPGTEMIDPATGEVL
jgi:hypothetical protein